MTGRDGGRVAILYPGDRATWLAATPENNRFAGVFGALAERGLEAVPAVYDEELQAETRELLLAVDAVLVWINPIRDGGRDRCALDALLREVAAAGIFVSAHPDVIAKIGTKEVLVRTREIGWGSDVHKIAAADQLRLEFLARLARGARVLKRLRGNGGLGVWKVELAGRSESSLSTPTDLPSPDSPISVREAVRGGSHQVLPLAEALVFFEAELEADVLIDQAYQQRLPEGMVRCYLVHNIVMGFGHQAANALLPAPPGSTAEPPPAGPRLYYPPTMPQFQRLKRVLEQQWVPAMQRTLDIPTHELPILWDCDFLLGPADAAGEDTYVLCEINASSVAPFPDSALPAIADAVVARIRARRSQRPTLTDS